MDRILISLISDHLVPNYLFAMEKIDLFDCFVFITTKEMEVRKVSEHLEKAFGYDGNSIERIVVDNDNYAAIMEKLSNSNFLKEHEYWINQTGGTKAMSIAMFDFFSDFNSHFIYIPIGKNCYFDFTSKQSIDINYRMSLSEYLHLYGLQYEKGTLTQNPPESPWDLYEKLKENRFFLTQDIKDAHIKDSSLERKYYSGEWFEDFVYLKLKEDLCLPENAIFKSTRIYRDENDKVKNDNEIDVMFVKDNALYIIECKVSMIGKGDSRETVLKYQYKLAAIAKDLGLRVNPYIFTLHRMWAFTKETQKAIEKRNRILGIRKIVNGKDLSNKLSLY